MQSRTTTPNAASPIVDELTEREAMRARLDRSIERQRLLSETAARFLSGGSPDDVVPQLFRAVAGPLGLDACFNFMVDDDGKALHLESCIGVSEEVARGLARLEFGQAVCGIVAKTGQSMYVPDIQSTSEPAAELVRSLGIRAYACNPLIVDDRVRGTLSFGTRSRDRFDEEDLAFFRTITHFVAVAKQRRRADRLARRLAAIVESSEDAIVSKDLDGIVKTWNKGAERLFGYTAEDIVGKSITTIIPPERHDEERMILSRIRAGVHVDSFETVRRRKDGSTVHISLTVSPIKDRQGRVIGASKIARDISERKRTEERLRLLAIEVDHRTKNMLSVLQALIRMTRAHSTAEYVDSIQGRVMALSHAHTLLSQTGWAGAELRHLIEKELAAYDGGDGRRAQIDGPALALTPTAVQPMAMALHELASNAAKYGAFSTPDGRLIVAWHVGDDGEVVLRWTERGGPPVHTPAPRGLGIDVIEQSIVAQLDGRVDFDWQADGLVCAITLPADQIAQGRAAASERMESVTPAR